MSNSIQTHVKGVKKKKKKKKKPLESFNNGFDRRWKPFLFYFIFYFFIVLTLICLVLMMDFLRILIFYIGKSKKNNKEEIRFVGLLKKGGKKNHLALCVFLILFLVIVDQMGSHLLKQKWEWELEVYF